MFRDVKFIDWLRYSGAVITLHLNPLHWWVLPHVARVKDEFSTRDTRWEFKFLFVKICVWVDDGRW